MRMLSTLLGLGCLLLLVGCQDIANTPENEITPSYSKDHWTSVTPTQTNTGNISPNGGREARRLTLPQLRTIIPKLFGGMTWTGRSNSKMFDRLAGTLGEADYVFQTASTRDATPLFMKFMDDMAAQMCNKAIDHDLGTKDKEPSKEKLVVLDERNIDKTLRFLRLKFHTVHVPESSTQGINTLRKLYDKVLLETSDRKQAWRAVCFTVVTAPEFFAY